MTSELMRWAIAERQFLKEDIKWLKAGAVLKSPSGDNITPQKLKALEARLEHAELAISDGLNAQGS
jgi:hypothetical protein